MVLRGTFQTSGQNCAGIERVLVHASVHNAFVQRVVKVCACARRCWWPSAVMVHAAVTDFGAAQLLASPSLLKPAV